MFISIVVRKFGAQIHMPADWQSFSSWLGMCIFCSDSHNMSEYFASCQHIGSIFENLFIFTTDFFLLLLLSFGRYWPHITPANKLQMGWCYVVSRVKITCTFMFMNAKKKQHSKSCVLFTIIANRECLRFGFRDFVSFFRSSLSRGSLYSVTSSFRSFTQI